MLYVAAMIKFVDNSFQVMPTWNEVCRFNPFNNRSRIEFKQLFSNKSFKNFNRYFP